MRTRSGQAKRSSAAGYLKNEIAFAEIRLLFARDLRAEAPSPFCALFLEILQDLEKRRTQSSRGSLAR